MSDEPKPTREECKMIIRDSEQSPGSFTLLHFGPRELPRLARAYLAQIDEIEALRKDTERLDWLEYNRSKYGYVVNHILLSSKSTLREAIDAAKEKK